MEQGMFIHSWDIDGDTDRLADHFINLNCNTMAVNVSYHHAGAADLRLGHMHYRKGAGTAFTVDPLDYGGNVRPAEGELPPKSHILKGVGGQLPQFYTGKPIPLCRCGQCLGGFL